jgi:Ser/Thr protein kinase RdoA (MazF antagonist)
MEGAQHSLAAARENRVYRVDHGGARHALRLHRAGYRSDDELRAELQWMNAVAARGLLVPRPASSASGAHMHVIDGIQVDMVGWLSGAPADFTPGLLRRIGAEMARLHAASDDWTPPPGFNRWSWDRAGLLGEAPLWGRFWDNPTLSADQRALLETFRAEASEALAPGLDFGLIHADLVRENIMVDGDAIQLIDFDDGGYGFRLFDVATTLGKLTEAPDFTDLKAALIDGYRSIRPLDTAALDLFLALRAATYVGWIIPRMTEDGAAPRNARFIRAACDQARAWLRTT